jgi:DNA-binding NarL/FixJ family response regulator
MIDCSAHNRANHYSQRRLKRLAYNLLNQLQAVQRSKQEHENKQSEKIESMDARRCAMLSKEFVQPGIRVALIDPCPAFRIGLEAAFNSNPMIQVVHSDNDFDTLSASPNIHVDVVITDLSADRAQTLKGLARIQRMHRRARVLAFLNPGEIASIIAPPDVSITGYQVKTAPTQEILSSLMEVCAGNPTIAPSLTSELVTRVARTSIPAPTRLSHRQAEVLELLSQGRTNLEIASKLRITEPTVKYHVSSIFAKLKVKNRTEAATLMASAPAA